MGFIVGPDAPYITPEDMGTITSKILGRERGKGEIKPHRKDPLPVYPEAIFVHMRLRCSLTHVGASLFHPSISFSHPPLPPFTSLFLKYLLSTECMRSLQEQHGMQKECRVWILLCAAATGWERAKHAGPPLTTGGQWHLGKHLSRQIQAVKSGLGEQGDRSSQG